MWLGDADDAIAGKPCSYRGALLCLGLVHFRTAPSRGEKPPKKGKEKKKKTKHPKKRRGYTT
ncbi:MAG: hypothetical protein ABWY28_03950, partial [Pseudomonas prosekii]